ncbi:hypothetical protein ACFZAR_32235 [Streptomyces sp. NPDC008222]|uniref:hypothetical protein n=1 Tax=Streptomyces sp. NPDC008222 TaxID=3364820 RepID=UPI0036DFA79E
MASDPAHRTQTMPATDEGYGGRYEEDSFDYPSAAPAAPGLGEEVPAERDALPSSEPQAGSESKAEETSPATGLRGLGELAAARRGLLLSVAAGLLALGGFGTALSMVSDTVSSDPSPGSTAQVSSPTSPVAQPPAPSQAASSPTDAGALPGGTSPTSPSPTGAVTSAAAPGTGDHQEDGQDDQEREDGDRSGDG